MRKLCEWKGVNIVEAECCPDHIHMLLEIPPKMSVSAFVGYLKGKSSLMIYEQFGELKFKYRNREFWCRGYYVDTVGKNKAKIAEYIRHQLAEDKLGEQLSIPYAGSPFTGRLQQKCRCRIVYEPVRARLAREPYRHIRRKHRLCRWDSICVGESAGMYSACCVLRAFRRLLQKVMDVFGFGPGGKRKEGAGKELPMQERE